MVLFSAERQTKEVSLLEKIRFVSGSTMFDSHEEGVCQTVAGLLEGPLRGRMRPVCMVQPYRDPAGNTMVLPQGAIRLGETLACAALRVLCEQLSIDSNSLRFEEYIGSFYNPIPEERQKDGVHTKHIHFVLVSTTVSRLALNPASTKNVDVTWAYGLPVLVGLMAEVAAQRPLKYKATVAAAIAAGVWPNQHHELVAAAD